MSCALVYNLQRQRDKNLAQLRMHKATEESFSLYDFGLMVNAVSSGNAQVGCFPSPMQCHHWMARWSLRGSPHSLIPYPFLEAEIAEKHPRVIWPETWVSQRAEEGGPQGDWVRAVTGEAGVWEWASVHGKIKTKLSNQSWEGAEGRAGTNSELQSISQAGAETSDWPHLGGRFKNPELWRTDHQGPKGSAKCTGLQIPQE